MHLLSWPTISELIARNEPMASNPLVWDGALSNEQSASEADERKKQPLSRGAQQVRAEQQWQGAIAALEQLLLQCATATDEDEAIVVDGNPLQKRQGVLLTGPSAILRNAALMQRFQNWIFSGDGATPVKSLISADCTTLSEQAAARALKSLPLLAADPLASEPFCLAFTPNFGCIMTLGEDAAGDPAFLFSFDPATVSEGWRLLQPRALLSGQESVNQIDAAIAQFPPPAPDYRLVMQFSRLLLQNLPDWTDLANEPYHKARAAKVQLNQQLTSRNQDKTSHPAKRRQPLPEHLDSFPESASNHLDIELLQAVAHEVRTPLSTIRTLTRLLIKRKDLAPEVKKRLAAIDRECTEQIDRFGLIFRAVELETTPVKQAPICLTATSLDEVLQHSIPRWQQQASRHNLTLDVALPKQLPMVVSDPIVLDQVLMGLIETFTRNLPGGSDIRVQVMLAGNQLKLQLQSRPQAEDETLQAEDLNPPHFAETAKPIGQILMFQPETGSLSLNLAVTKQLFQALGGRLLVRQRPNQGKVMTIFLPLELSSLSS